MADDLSRSKSHKKTEAFDWSSSADRNDEEDLKWAALEKLPTYDRMRKGILMKEAGEGKLVGNEVDIQKLSVTERKILTDHILKVVEEDNEHFLHQLKARTDRVGIELPKIEVRFEDLLVEADTYINNRAVPTLLNSILNIVEGVFSYVWFSPPKKKVHGILNGINGIIKPLRISNWS